MSSLRGGMPTTFDAQVYGHCTGAIGTCSGTVSLALRGGVDA